MNLQFISDSKGKTTGVFIPIAEWNELKEKYKGIGLEKIDIPERQKIETKKRVADYKKNPDQVLEFNRTMEDIEKDLSIIL